MNSKGQTLIMLIVVLPLLLLIIAAVVDINLMYYEKNKLDNLNMMVTLYGIDNISDNNLEEKIYNLINKNDRKTVLKKLDIEENKVRIVLNKSTKSIFGKIIGIEEYKITSKYIGINDNDKKEIKKG